MWRKWIGMFSTMQSHKLYGLCGKLRNLCMVSSWRKMHLHPFQWNMSIRQWIPLWRNWMSSCDRYEQHLFKWIDWSLHVIINCFFLCIAVLTPEAIAGISAGVIAAIVIAIVVVLAATAGNFTKTKSSRLLLVLMFIIFKWTNCMAMESELLDYFFVRNWR